MQIELAAGGGGPHRVEQGRLDIDVDGRLGARGALAADDPAEAQRAAIVGDHGHVRFERVNPAVQGVQALAGSRAAHREVAVELVGIEDVERAAEIESEEIGDVDERRDRPQADRLQPLREPGRARPVGDAAHHPAEEERAGLVVGPSEMDRDGAGKSARQRIGRALARAGGRKSTARAGGRKSTARAGGRKTRARAGCLTLVPSRRQRPEPPESRRREVARDAAHGEAIGAVRRHLDVEHRVVEPDDLCVGPADREAGGELDDALAVLGESELPARAQHAVRGDAAYAACLQFHAAARDDRARRREDAEHAGARIGRAAYHLDFARPRIDGAEAQLVGIGMRLGLDYAGDPEGRQSLGAVLDRIDLEAAHHQERHDLVERGLGREMGLEPGKARLHRAGPITSDGRSSGRKP